MPSGDIPGWRQTFAEDFDQSGLDKRWWVYEGQPGGDPGGWFSRSHVTQSDGRLVITGSREKTPNGDIYATGGISNSKTFSQTYGRFEFRFRMDEGYGINFALLLWPADNSWPPEINVAEDTGRSRDLLTATLHYGDDNSTIARKSSGVYDMTQWHTAAVEWAPGSLTYLLDGKAWTSPVTSSDVPNIDMTMAIQAQAWPCGSSFSDCPNATTPATVRLEVDWAVAYAAE
jgi:beta-glucanase (GH16 family)